MELVEIQYDELSKEAISNFWNGLVSLNAKSVKVNLSTETATISGIINNWLLDQNKKAGIRLNLYETMLAWDRLSESWVSDDDYQKIIKKESEGIISQVRLLAPIEIEVHYSIDDEVYNET